MFNNYQKFLFLFILGFLFFPQFLYAADNDLIVNFETDPLFNESNFLPGDQIIKSVEVINNTSDTKDIIAEAINVEDPENFSDVLNLVIKEGEEEIFSGRLSEFFRAGEVSLSSLSGEGGGTIYKFLISFPEGTNNEFQGKGMAFDILIGFAGEESGGGSSSGGSSGGGGGGGIIRPPGLTIKEETVEVIDITTTSAAITWTTSYRSTSRVVYGTIPNAFDFNNLPNYGYEFSSPEFDSPAKTNGVLNHSVALTDLTPGTTYYFRAISHASPPVISFEYMFKTLSEKVKGKKANNIIKNEGAGGIQVRIKEGGEGGEILPNYGKGYKKEEEVRERGNTGFNGLLAALLSLFPFKLGNIPLWLWLIIIIIIIIIWLVLRKKEKTRKKNS